jgi:hypothetical protein
MCDIGSPVADNINYFFFDAYPKSNDINDGTSLRYKVTFIEGHGLGLYLQSSRCRPCCGQNMRFDAT